MRPASPVDQIERTYIARGIREGRVKGSGDVSRCEWRDTRGYRESLGGGVSDANSVIRCAEGTERARDNGQRARDNGYPESEEVMDTLCVGYVKRGGERASGHLLDAHTYATVGPCVLWPVVAA